MKKKHLFFLFSFMATLLSSFNGNAQPIETRELLKKSYEALSNIRTVVYKIDYANKYLSRKDTIHTTAVCSLYVAPKDKMKAYNIVDVEFVELNVSTYGHRRYDGNRTFWTNYLVDSLNVVKKPEIYSDKQTRRAVVNNYSNILLKEYFMQKKPFIRYQSASDKILVTEEVHKGISVYVITIAFKDKKDVRDNIEKHYIRKSDFLPIAYYSFLRWENMEQYNYYEVEYLAINPDIPLEKFKVGENETIKAEERYKNLKKKAKI